MTSWGFYFLKVKHLISLIICWKKTWNYFLRVSVPYSGKVAGMTQEQPCLFTLLRMCRGAEMSMVILPVPLSPLWFNLISCSRWNTLRTIWTKANIHLDGKCDRTRGGLGAWLILLPRSYLYFITKVTEATTAFCKNRKQSV